MPMFSFNLDCQDASGEKAVGGTGPRQIFSQEPEISFVAHPLPNLGLLPDRGSTNE
jgi:hypothetical protein